MEAKPSKRGKKMIKPSFCNYHQKYYQRLGFLKVISIVGENVRGGQDEILSRFKALFPQSTIGRARSQGILELEKLLCIEEIPSWGIGFLEKEQYRVLTWANKVGIMAPTGRLSEWATILKALRKKNQKVSWAENNPFLLSLEERAFFIQLLFYHDQVMPALLFRLGELTSGSHLSLYNGSLVMTQAIGDYLDTVKGNSPDEMKVRVLVRDILERIGKQYGLPDPRALFNSESRAEVMNKMQLERKKGKRNHLAEYHTVCRFEQLTDLGLLVKENPTTPSQTYERRKSIRTDWNWYIVPSLHSAGSLLLNAVNDIESFLLKAWMQFCATLYKPEAERLDVFMKQLEVAEYLDATLPYARRQIGPVQLHTWISLACITAFSAQKIMEISHVNELLMAIHRHPKLGSLLRIGGQGELRGRTAAVASKSIYSMLKENPVAREESDDKK